MNPKVDQYLAKGCGRCSFYGTPGPNSQASRQVRFTGVEKILALEPVLKSYIHEAIEVEKTGQKVTFNQALTLPEELRKKFNERPDLKQAFEALTPGR